VRHRVQAPVHEPGAGVGFTRRNVHLRLPQIGGEDGGGALDTAVERENRNDMSPPTEFPLMQTLVRGPEAVSAPSMTLRATSTERVGMGHICRKKLPKDTAHDRIPVLRSSLPVLPQVVRRRVKPKECHAFKTRSELSLSPPRPQNQRTRRAGFDRPGGSARIRGMWTTHRCRASIPFARFYMLPQCCGEPEIIPYTEYDMLLLEAG